MNENQIASKSRKRTTIVIAVLLIIIFSWWGFAQQEQQKPEKVIKFAQVSQGKFELLVSSTGTLAAVETVDIGTQVSGTIDKLMVDYNDTVEKGQVLAVLDQSLFNASMDNARAAVLKAEAELQQAEAEYTRNKPLYEKGFISEQEFLPIKTEMNMQKATLLSAEAGLRQAMINLDYTVISSPIDGTVIDRSVDAGQTVAASLSTPTLFLIAKDLSHMQIETNVDETDIGQIRKGQAVRFTVQSYLDQTFTGSVRQIRMQPETVDNVVTYTVIVEAENEFGLLLPGMTATVDFIVHDVEKTLLVPVAALSFNPDVGSGKILRDNKTTNSQVFCKAEGGQLKAVTITTGKSDSLVTVVKEGDLTEGEFVAIGFGQNMSKDEPDSGFSLSSLFGQGMGQATGPGPGGRR